MASLRFQLSNPSDVYRGRAPNPNSVIFTRLPSRVSLNFPIKTHETQKGLIENLHLVSLSKQAKLEDAHEFLNAMDLAGISVNTHSYECLLEACRRSKSLSYGRIFNDRMRKTVKNPSGFLHICLLRMYIDCCSFSDARQVFDEMPTKNLVSWSTMVYAFAQNGHLAEAFGLFSEMQMEGVNPNASVYVSLIRAISIRLALKLGKQIHSHLIRSGLIPDSLIDTALSYMYVQCGCLESSTLVFNRIAEKNVATWTELMARYTRREKQEEALLLFNRMIGEHVQLDQFVFSIVLKACSGLENLCIGRQIHGCVCKYGMDSDVSAGTPLVDLYVKCGSLGDAHRAFERIVDPNEVSWSAIISGYAQMGKFEESLKMFEDLRRRDTVSNPFIYTSIFQVCSALADLNFGSQLHGDAIKRGLISDLYGESALVTMYSRSGSLDYAHRAFESIVGPDAVAWTAIIAGYAYHGLAVEALRLFRRMQSCDVKPNSVTFIAVLTACSHSGFVSEARQYLDSMDKDYGVKPTLDHYDCMVDIYCRSGFLKDAFELMKTMPFEPSAMTWRILLGGCRTHHNVYLGKIAGENLLRMEPGDTAAYVLLFNLYASAGKWEEAAYVRKVMAERGVRKEVSCSWITIKDKVHRFIVGDRHHPRTEEIYSKLEELNKSAIDIGSAHHADDVLCDLHGERKEQLLDHSERLAVAFGLISTPSNVPILVFQNLRVCRDCHSFMKAVSKITEREVVVRDSSRFHHFMEGECSCNNFW